MLTELFIVTPEYIASEQRKCETSGGTQRESKQLKLLKGAKAIGAHKGNCEVELGLHI